jgi:four helix bundle protein
MGREKGGVQERTKAFAMDILRMYPDLAGRDETRMIARQMIRSGTSIGSHIREGKRARSDAELISKIESALQEMEETVYWLELLQEYEIIERAKMSQMLKEADELASIMVASVKTLKSRIRKWASLRLPLHSSFIPHHFPRTNPPPNTPIP